VESSLPALRHDTWDLARRTAFDIPGGWHEYQFYWRPAGCCCKPILDDVSERVDFSIIISMPSHHVTLTSQYEVRFAYVVHYRNQVPKFNGMADL